MGRDFFEIKLGAFFRGKPTFHAEYQSSSHHMATTLRAGVLFEQSAVDFMKVLQEIKETGTALSNLIFEMGRLPPRLDRETCDSPDEPREDAVEKDRSPSRGNFFS